MLQELENSSIFNLTALLTDSSKQPPEQSFDANPSLLPDTVYFALLRQRKAEAAIASQITCREIERGLKARLSWKC